MAYTFFPTSTAQIVKECASKPDNAAEIVGLFQYLSKKFKQVKTPVNIDVKKLGVVNVTRELQGTIDINTIKKDLKLQDIKIKFGAGSAGNRGVKNRGNLFENTFANAVEAISSILKINLILARAGQALLLKQKKETFCS